MIQITVKAKIVAGKQHELRAIADILQHEFSVKEQGCIQYESYIDGDTFLTLEKWYSQEDLDVHLASDHVKHYVPKLKNCVEDGEFHVDFVYDGRRELEIF